MPPTQPHGDKTHWAVLIGVNLYPNPPNSAHVQDNAQDNSLKAAVADVEAMEAFFSEWPHVKVSKLTASKRPAGESQRIPAEDPQDQPTIENVSALLEEVIAAGTLKKIKHVYIHFSGHGKKNSERELRLGLYRPNPRGSPDFKTSMLRNYIDRMINQGMKVTVMLDCCFSAGVKRTGHFALGDVRFLDEQLGMEEEEEPKFNSVSTQDDSSQLRSARLQVDRLLDARGYTIITACGQDEQTREIVVNGMRRSPLSYYLLRSLQRLKSEGSQVTITTLHENLQNQFRSIGLDHVPRRYGRTNICFFESLLSGPDAVFTSVSYNRKAGYILNAGQAHGVCVGDRYEVSAWWVSENVQSRSNEQPDEFVVETTRSLTSVIKLNGTPKAGDSKSRSLKAKVVSFSSRQKITVHITDSLPQADQEQLRQVLSGNKVLQVSITDQPLDMPAFNVDLDGNAFRVLDGAAEPIPNVSPIQRSARAAVDSLARTLEHLAKFKFLQGLENLSPDPEFEKLFSMTCVDGLGDDGRYHTKHNELWELHFKNLGKEPLYVHVFNLCSSWSVKDLIRDEGEDPDGLEIAPESEFTFPMMMKIPHHHQPRAEDVLKFIVTSKPTQFPLISLPEIGDSGETRGSDGFNEFHDFIFSGLGAMRNDRDAKWSTRNFTVVISR